MNKIVFFDVKSTEKEFLDKLNYEGCEIIQLEESIQDAVSQNLEKLKDAKVISVFTDSRLYKEQLDKFKDLRLVTTRSTGFSHIDTDYCKEKSIEVVNVPKYGNTTVAEYAFALLLSVVRNIKLSSDDLRKNQIIPERYIGMDLCGKTVGVIGTGAIGAHFCKIAKGFGMNIMAYDPYPKTALINELEVDYVSLEALLKKSDIISIHAPSTASNVHMIDFDQFKIMKDGVVIINTARGELVNSEALYNALLSGKIGAAGLDVVECEEILALKDGQKFLKKVDCKIQSCLEKAFINHRLLTMDNVIITPHMAYDTKEALERILITTKQNIEAFLNKKIINSVL